MFNNIHTSNFLNSKSELNIHKIQLERLLKINSQINNSNKISLKFIEKKYSQKFKKKEENEKINYENSILFNRMLNLVKKPSPYNLNINKPIYCAAFDNKNSSYKKSQSIEKIKKKNQFLYNRFLNVKSYYNTKKILKENDFNRYLENNFKKLYRKIHNINFCTFKKFKENVKNEIKNNNKSFNNNNKSYFCVNNNNSIKNFIFNKKIDLKRSQSAKNNFFKENSENNSENFYFNKENFNNSFNNNNSSIFNNSNKNIKIFFKFYKIILK